MTDALNIPDKKYFKIGEVCEMVDLKPHVLRYWESEFKIINPVKTKSNQRLYRKKDVQAICTVKELLYEKKYTIAGAKKKLKLEKQKPQEQKTPTQLSLDFTGADYKLMLKKIVRELKQIKAELDES